MSLRVTRSQTRDRSTEPDGSSDVKLSTNTRQNTQPQVLNSNGTLTYTIPGSITSRFSSPFKSLPDLLERKYTKLSNKHHQVLLHKQQRLRHLNLVETFESQDRFVNRDARSARKAVEIDQGLISQVVASTLIFASESAGTAVCIDPSGLILTCAHCIAESRAELMSPKSAYQWLLSSSGQIIQTRCVAWDEKRDLALLKVTAAQGASNTQMSSITIAKAAIKKNTNVLCIGHPGSEDLELEESGIPTDYPVLAISEGKFLGYASGQDIQDNSDIGTLVHDAWTYWGHSGAPLIHAQNGQLVGCHSSWDDEDGTRRGVGIEAIKGFLDDIAENAGHLVTLP